MEKNWKIIARDTIGNEKLLHFCKNMAEGKDIIAKMHNDERLKDFSGELVLKALNPEWITETIPSDYSHYVRSLIPDDEWLKVTETDDPDAFYNYRIDNMKEYYLLSQVIPHSFTVIDFGCANNAQSYLFTKHKRFIAIDTKKEQFRAPGTLYLKMTAGEFITNELSKLNLNMQRTFAICSNVTGKNYENPGMLVRMNFLNMYTINNFKSIVSNEKTE